MAEYRLPVELRLLIAEQLERMLPPRPRQATFAKLCLVSKAWYDVSVPFLYQRPQVSGRNFDLFYRTIYSPSETSSKGSLSRFRGTGRTPRRLRSDDAGLGDLVEYLDLTRLVHHSSRSITARLLGRVKNELRVLRAPPRKALSINSFASLAKCKGLRVLDLYFLSGDGIKAQDLSRVLHSLQHLEALRLWPQVRQERIEFQENVIHWPSTLRTLSIPTWYPIPMSQWETDFQDLNLSSATNAAYTKRWEAIHQFLLSLPSGLTALEFCACIGPQDFLKGVLPLIPNVRWLRVILSTDKFEVFKVQEPHQIQVLEYEVVDDTFRQDDVIVSPWSLGDQIDSGMLPSLVNVTLLALLTKVVDDTMDDDDLPPALSHLTDALERQAQRLKEQHSGNHSQGPLQPKGVSRGLFLESDPSTFGAMASALRYDYTNRLFNG